MNWMVLLALGCSDKDDTTDDTAATDDTQVSTDDTDDGPHDTGDTEDPVDTGPFDQDGDGVDAADDCDDDDASVYPGALEVCDGADNDCNGAVDDSDAWDNIPSDDWVNLSTWALNLTGPATACLAEGNHTGSNFTQQTVVLMGAGPGTFIDGGIRVSHGDVTLERMTLASTSSYALDVSNGTFTGRDLVVTDTGKDSAVRLGGAAVVDIDGLVVEDLDETFSVWQGTIMMNGATGTLRNVTLRNNTVQAENPSNINTPGILVANTTNQGTVVIEDLAVHDNTFTSDGYALGSAVYVWNGGVEARRVRVEGNTLDGPTLEGGALVATEGARATFDNVLVRGESYNEGAGPLVNFGNNATMTVTNATIVDNDVYAGGAIWISGDTTPGSLTVRNAIFAYNQAEAGLVARQSQAGITLTLDHINVYGNIGTTADYSMATPTETARTDVDPAFVDWEGGDLHLASDSPLVDAGLDSLTDPDGTRSDLGAYGGPSAWTD